MAAVRCIGPGEYSVRVSDSTEQRATLGIPNLCTPFLAAADQALAFGPEGQYRYAFPLLEAGEFGSISPETNLTICASCDDEPVPG